MRSPYYLDTCSLLCWAYARLPDATAEESAASIFIEEIVAAVEFATAVSAITLMEFYDNVAATYRGRRRLADERWLTGVMDDLARWQASSAIDVLDTPPKLFEHAMRYVKLNTVAGQHKFRSMDAAHLVHAIRWARILRKPVNLVSYDSDFTKLVRRYPEFEAYIVQVDPRDGRDVTHRR